MCVNKRFPLTISAPKASKKKCVRFQFNINKIVYKKQPNNYKINNQKNNINNLFPVFDCFVFLHNENSSHRSFYDHSRVFGSRREFQ